MKNLNYAHVKNANHITNIAQAQRYASKLYLEIINNFNITHKEFINSRSLDATEARARISIITKELLSFRMSEVEIAEWLYLPRTTLRNSLNRWRKTNGHPEPLYPLSRP